MRISNCFVLFFIFAVTEAQEITVLDQTTKEPVHNVAIFNEGMSKRIFTNLEGKADFSIFTSEETIFLKHVSHLQIQCTKQKILKNNGIIYMKVNQNRLKEVVLSVSKFIQKREDIPRKVLSLSSQDIVFSHPQTAADLLEHTGQVFIQKSQLGGGSPMIRGFATNRLLITVDGVRMNTAIFRSGNVQNIISIDPFAIERTEVIFGPGSVVYGSDAIGGVMSFYTRSPHFSNNEKTSFSGNAYARYARANNENTGHVDFSVGTQKWVFLTSLSYSDFDGMRMGSHGPEDYLRPEYVIRRNGKDVVVQNENPIVQVPSGYNQFNVLQKIKFKPNREWDFGLGVFYSTTSDYPRYDRLYRKRDGKFRAADWYYGPQEWLMSNFQINKKGNGNIYDDAKLTLAYQYFGESRNDRGFQKEILYGTNSEVDAYSANLDFEKDFSRDKLFYGLEYVHNTVHSAGTETNILTDRKMPGTSRYPDGSTWQSLAVYGNYRWKINPDLVLQTGVRYNHILLDASFDDAGYDLPFSEANLNTGAFTGSVGMRWQQNEILGLRFNLSTAFRAPNIDDIGKVFDSEPGAVVVPNPNLKPEYSYNSELGLNLNFDKIVELNFTGYYTYLDHALVRRDFNLNGQTVIDYQGEPSRVQAIQNAAHAYVYGLEAGAAVHFNKNISLKSNLNITIGKEEQDDGSLVPLRHAAPIFGNVHLVWSNKTWTFDVNTTFNGELRYEDLAPSQQRKSYLYATDKDGNPYSPSWNTFNLNTQYIISKNWVATAALENILDKRYRTYSSGIAASGINLVVAVKYNF